MSALPPLAVVRPAHDQYVVSFGKSGAVGVFTAAAPLALRRGRAVVLQTSRGLEIGSVLCPASLRQARILGAVSSGALLRPVEREDEERRDQLSALEQAIFETGRAWVSRDELPLEILDVELLFDGEQAIVQFVGEETGTEHLAASLREQFRLMVRLENLAPATPSSEEEPEPRCDKPDCGRTAEGGGCTTCSTGGGCSSCGSGKPDLRPYFSHLRDKMETNQRIPLA